MKTGNIELISTLRSGWIQLAFQIIRNDRWLAQQWESFLKNGSKQVMLEVVCANDPQSLLDQARRQADPDFSNFRNCLETMIENDKRSAVIIQTMTIIRKNSPGFDAKLLVTSIKRPPSRIVYKTPAPKTKTMVKRRQPDIVIAPKSHVYELNLMDKQFLKSIRVKQD